MKRIVVTLALVVVSTSVQAKRIPEYDTIGAAASGDYLLLSDTSDSGRENKVALSGIRAALGLGTTDNVTFGNVTAGGGTLYAGVANTTQGTLVLYTNTDPIYTAGWLPAASPTAIVSLRFPPAPAGGSNYLFNFDADGTGGWTDPATFAAALGVDDNYVTDAEKTVIGNTSGTNTGDQTSASSLTVTATGFDGNLDANDDTVQEVAQALDDLVAGGDNLGSATYSNVVSLWTTCSGYLKSDGTCDTPSGSGDMVLASAQSVTGAKTFDPSMLLMKGTSTGVTTFATANTSASNYTVTFPATTGTVALTSQLFDPAAPGAIGGTTPAAGTFTTVTAATYATSAADGSRKSELPNNSSATPTGGGVEEIYNEGGQIKVVEADTEYNMLHSGDVDDTPVNGATADPVSSNWAYDHAAASDPHTGYVQESALGSGTLTMLGNAPGAEAGPTTTIETGTSALGTSEIASGACASAVSTAATNAATTDVINWGFNADPTSTTGYAPTANGMLTIIAYPTSGYVNFKVCNLTAAAITPGAVTLNWRIQR